MGKVKDILKKEIVDIAVVLDESGSMATILKDAIGGFNTFLKQQKEDGDDAVFSLVSFDSEIKERCSRVPLKEAKELTHETYIPGTMTALYDAIGTVISNVAKSNTNNKVIVAILTDGDENNSKEYNKEQINKLIEEKTKLGWEFIFLAANQDAFAAGLSIRKDNCISFATGVKGVVGPNGERGDVGLHGAYGTMGVCATTYRSNVRNSK